MTSKRVVITARKFINNNEIINKKYFIDNI